VFSPDPDLVSAVAVAAERWSAATGCEIALASDGVPVSLLDAIPTLAAEFANGYTTLLVTEDGDFAGCSHIYVARTAQNVARTVLHEMAHCLGAMTHSDSGLMAERPVGDPPIDAIALELVCVNLTCPERHPEN